MTGGINIKKIIWSLIFLLVLFAAAPARAYAEDTGSLSSDADYAYYDYVLDSYDINIDVNEDNSLDISEKIVAYFNVPKHGIYRNIPLRNRITRLDGTVSYNRAKISDIMVDADYTVSYADGDKVLKIGDADITLKGAREYNISYRYDLGKDTGKDYDELYFNLIGNEWDTTIGGITFTITMPKGFDEAKLGFSSGYEGSEDSSDITYTVSGNVITGSLNAVLEPGEGLTVRLELPDGYFINETGNMDLQMVLSFVLPLLFALITVCLWLRFGRDEPVTETVEFYPPKGFNSAEVGFMYKGKANSNDVVSLLIYLANKGYIRISEIGEKSLFKRAKAFKLIKLKEYDGDNENERIFLSGLFSHARITDIAALAGLYKEDETKQAEAHEEVTSYDLYNSFYVTLNKIVQNLNSKENRQTIYEKSSLGKGFFVALMVIATFVLITVRPIIEYSGSSLLVVALLFPGIGFSVLFAMVFGKTKMQVKIFGLVWGLGFGGMPWAFVVLPALLADKAYLAAYVFGLACIFIMVIMLKVMPKRTAYGNELLGRIKGFKTFLETAEKPKLEELVSDDPAYFYDILPFTYVLGVSDKWIKKFEVIALQAPDWYDGRTAFSVASFSAFIDSTMTSASAAMASSPSGSGGSSGGGSSGGGSGGGGGGSW